MAENLTLRFVSASSVEQLKVLWIEVVTPTGEFIVGPLHAPLVSLVTPSSKLLYKKLDGALGMFTLSGGILCVDNNEATIILRAPLEN